MRKLLGAVVALVLSTQPALLHEWYPMECCSGQDCAPAMVMRLEPSTLMPAQMGFGPMIVTNEFGTVVVPDDFKRRRSPDGRWHACIRRSMVDGVPSVPKLICLFEPDPV